MDQLPLCFSETQEENLRLLFETPKDIVKSPLFKAFEVLNNEQTQLLNWLNAEVLNSSIQGQWSDWSETNVEHPELCLLGQAAQVYRIIPFAPLSALKGFALVESEACNQLLATLLYEKISELFFLSLMEQLHAIRIETIADEAGLISVFENEIKKATVPTALRIGQWQSYCKLLNPSDSYLHIEIGREILSFRYSTFFHPGLGLPVHKTGFYEIRIRHIKKILSGLASNLFRALLISPEKQEWQNPNLEELLQSLEKSQDLYKEVEILLREQRSHLSGIKALQSGRKSDYEFYKSTAGWHIRFEGRLIEMQSKNEKGLSSIHYLMTHPNVSFFPDDLEPVEMSNDKEIELQLGDSLSVSIHSKYSKMNSGNEKEILKDLKHLEMEKTKEAASEEYIYYLAQRKHLLYQLKSYRTKNEYFILYNMVSDSLEEVKRQFTEETDDGTLVKRVITKAGMISRPTNYNTETDRARQRVVRNIMNAIKSMNDTACQAFFQKNIKAAIHSQYTPPANFHHEWVLFTED